MNPADDYVSDFVAGISRLKVVKAHAVMKPATNSHALLNSSSPTFDTETNLSTLITAAISHEGPLRIVDQTSVTVGTVDRADLLNTVIEGTETS